jgi:TPR repeat protein
MPKNEALARETFDRIHRQGRAFSAFCLAFMQEHGLAVEQDGSLAQRHYTQAAETFAEEAERGLPPSLNNLGFMYAQGKGVDQDPSKAAARFRAAAAAGFEIAKVNLGICHLKGFGVDKDEAAAFRLFKEAADLGSGAGAACVGQMLRDGVGVEGDVGAGLKYLREAAEAGDAQSWLELGKSYDLGLGIDVDREEAEKWYTLAAADGDPEAQAHLASLLAAPGATEGEFRKAMKLIDQSSDQGCDFADYFRGTVDLYGNQWHAANPIAAQLTAARLSARSVLGVRLQGKICDHGSGGLGRDPKKAAEWFRKAAGAGDPESQAEMGRRYEYGDGVARNLVEAYAWHSLAVSVRSTGAAQAIERLRRQLTGAEVSRAEMLSESRRVLRTPTRELQLDEK